MLAQSHARKPAPPLAARGMWLRLGVGADAFGSALGDAVIGSIVGGDQKKAPQKQEPEYQSKPLTQTDIDGFLSGLDDIPGANDGKDWSGFSKDRQARAAASRLGGAPNSLNELGGGLSGIDIPASSTPGQVAQKGDSWAKLARQQYGDERYALALAQANGANSTLLRAGDSVYFPDLSGADLKQGGQLIAADTQARAQRQAAAAQQATNANQSAEPVWSFKEASMAQRKLDDAAAAAAGRKIYEAGLANAPSASQWNGKSNDLSKAFQTNLEKAIVDPLHIAEQNWHVVNGKESSSLSIRTPGFAVDYSLTSNQPTFIALSGGSPSIKVSESYSFGFVSDQWAPMAKFSYTGGMLIGGGGSLAIGLNGVKASFQLGAGSYGTTSGTFPRQTINFGGGFSSSIGFGKQ
jgi:hypothetical protein